MLVFSPILNSDNEGIMQKFMSYFWMVLAALVLAGGLLVFERGIHGRPALMLYDGTTYTVLSPEEMREMNLYVLTTHSENFFLVQEEEDLPRKFVYIHKRREYIPYEESGSE